MELTFERDAGLAALGRIIGAASRNATIPILSHVLLTATAEGLGLRAAEPEMQAAVSCPAQVTKPGAITAPIGRVHDMLRNLPPGGQVALSLDATRLVAKCGRSRFVLPTLPAADFPVFAFDAEAARAAMPAKALARLIAKTAFAISTEATRHYLGGLYLHPFAAAQTGRALRAVATDGSRLAYAETACPDGWAEAPAVTVPRKAVGEIARLLEGQDGDAEFWTDGRLFGLAVGGAELATVLVQGNFPDYQRVVPHGPAQTVKLDVTELTAALKRAAVVTDEKSRPVKLAFSADGVAVRGRGTSGDQAEDWLDAGYEGAPVEFGFNAGFLAEGVGRMDGEQVWLELRGPGDPVRLVDPRDDTTLQVLMPLRLS